MHIKKTADDYISGFFQLNLFNQLSKLTELVQRIR
jgi:hypothetical protein